MRTRASMRRGLGTAPGLLFYIWVLGLFLALMIPVMEAVGEATQMQVTFKVLAMLLVCTPVFAFLCLIAEFEGPAIGVGLFQWSLKSIVFRVLFFIEGLSIAIAALWLCGFPPNADFMWMFGSRSLTGFPSTAHSVGYIIIVVMFSSSVIVASAMAASSHLVNRDFKASEATSRR